MYFAGNIGSYKNWQKLDICLLMIWVIPFPAAVIAGYYILKENKINTWIFMTCVTFPLLIIVNFMPMKDSNFNVKIKNIGEREMSINKNLENIFEEPYRKNCFWWEAFLVFLRLIVACIATFLIDSVNRLCCLTPVLVVFIVPQLRKTI